MRAEERFEKWFDSPQVKFAHQRLYRVDAQAAFLAGHKAGLEEAAEIVTDLLIEPSACVSAAIRARMEGVK